MIRKKVADEIFEVRFLPSGKLFGVVHNEGFYSFQTWTLPDFESEVIYEPVEPFESEDFELTISIAPEAKVDTVAVAFQTNVLSFLFVVRDGNMVVDNVANPDETLRLGMSQDGKTLFVQDQAYLELETWKKNKFVISKDRLENDLGFWDERSALGFSSGNEHLVVWCPQTESLEIEDYRTGDSIAHIDCGDSHFSHVRFSHDLNSALFTFRGLCFADLTPEGPKVRDIEELNGSPLLKEARYFALHPNKDKVIFSKQTGQLVYVYSRQAKAIVEKFNWAHQTICGLDYSFDGLLAACGTINGEIIVWDVD